MQDPHAYTREPSRNIHSTHWQLQEVEVIINELRRVCSHEKNDFDDENIRREVEVLERWRDHYHRDLVTAQAFCETSSLILANLYDHLKLALDEMQRTQLGVNAAYGRNLAEKREIVINASYRIERILAPAVPY